MSFAENFKNFLENIPQGILDEEKKEAANIKDGAAMVDFAKKAHPQIFAYMKIFNTCCRVKEEIGIHKFIADEHIRARFDKFLREGGDIEKIRRGKVDEEYLTEGDLTAFREAEAEVHREVHKETREEIHKSRKTEFEEFMREGEKEVRGVEEKIVVLREMAGKSADFGGEILEKIGELEERWANFGNEPQEQDLAELLEYYNSVIGIEE